MSGNQSHTAPQTAKPKAKKLGRYRLLSEEGRGATAIVYRAYDPELDRYLAVKVLREELAQDELTTQSFIHEARLAAQLTHPGIVTIFDVGEADGKPYIAMELLEGATLESILKKQPTLALKTVLSIATQLAQALDYAHKNGVVHRDIKPANVVILKDKRTAKITDFGIAQLDDGRSRQAASTDKVLGTPEYMSPEQVLGKNVDARSDLYSLGVLIYRMLSGAPPFFDDDLAKLFKQIVKDRPSKISVTPEKVQDDIQDLLRKLLRKRPDKRFRDAREVVTELRRINRKIGKSPAKQKEPFVSLRLKWTATMAGVVFVAMCVGLVLVYWVQNSALSGITFDYGRSIARMLAYQSAESVVLNDRVGLSAIVKESGNNEQLIAADILDLNDHVLASTDEQRVDQKFMPPQGQTLEQTMGAVRIYSRQLSADKSDRKMLIYDVEMPIKYGEKQVGWAYVSFSGRNMAEAARTTLVTMLVVMLMTLIVIFIITLGFARKSSKDYQRVSQALLKMSQGRIDARLESDRNDEAGQLFNAFNALANYLERRFESDDIPSFQSLPKHTEIRRKSGKHQTPGSDDDSDHTIEFEIRN